MNKYLFFLILFLPFFGGLAQTGCPEVDAGEDQHIDCTTDPTVQISATYLDIGETNQYEVQSIDFAPPYPFDAGTNANVVIDDSWSSNISLPFTFCFFGNSHNTLQVGANGQVIFDKDYPANSVLQCAYALAQNNSTTGPPQTLPTNIINLSGNFINDVIMVMHDMDNSVPGTTGDIFYGVLGEEPCRAFVVNYFEMSHYSADCNSFTSTMQFVLYENTNAIDIYIDSKPSCPDFNGGYAVAGIMNSQGTVSYTPPDRNTSVWFATEEAWRFAPAGDPVVNFSWLDEDGNVLSNDADFTVSPTETTTYTAQVVYRNCDGEEIIDTDDVTVTVDDGGIDIEQPTDMVVCVQDINDNSEVFDLTSKDGEINHTNDSNLTITYHTDVTDASTGANPIPNPSSYTNTSNPQTIYASVLNTTNSCIQVVQFDLIINHPAEYTTIPDFQICDTDGDGVASFDLESLVDDIRVNASDVVTFHTSEIDAQNGDNPLTSPYQNTSNPQTIYVRIDNGLDCFLNPPYSFNLVVADQPSVNAGGVLEECSIDSTADFDLTELDSQVTSETGHVITYHATQADADAGSPALSSPYNSPTATIYVRVENSDGCFDTVTAELIVNEIPNPTLSNLTECDDGSGSADFDLDAYLLQLQTDNPGIVFSIHLSESDAQTGANPQTGTLSSSGQTLWVAMSNQTATECTNENSFDLVVQDEPGFNTIADYEICDTDSDGVASFDLDGLISSIQANGTDVITFHETEIDAQNGDNPIASPYDNTSNPQTIYVRVVSASGCILNTPYSFDIVVLEQPNIMNPSGLNLCSGSDTATFNLNLLDSQVTNDMANTVTYHASETDANAGSPTLPNPYTTTSTTIWVRVENADGCFDTVTADLTVTNSPNITLNNFEECELTQGGGTADFNLDTYLANLQATYPSLQLSIHLTEAEADAGSNPQTGIMTNTTNPETLWVAVVDPAAPECDDSFPFDLVVNPLPTIPTVIFELEACDVNENGQGQFTLSDADSSIDPSGIYTISYHASDADAQSNTAPLSDDYTSLATTVWARVVTGSGCFVTTPVELIVNPLPTANAVQEEVCSQTNVGEFDLVSLISGIIGSGSGVTVSFHDTQANADAGINNLSSPLMTQSRTVYARVEDDVTRCYNTAEIDLEVIVAPNTSINSFANCEEANSGSTTFDLEDLRSQIETDTGGTVTLHDTQAEAETDMNPLSGNITSSGGSVWAKITTSIVDCDGIREVALLMNPAPVISTYRVENCRLSDNPSEFVFVTTNLDQAYSYNVYESFAEADAGTSPVAAFPYTTTQDDTRLYVRVENRQTNCHSVSELELAVVDFFDNPIEPIVICYGEFYTLPDGTEISQGDGQYTYRNIENCSNDIYTFDFQVCNPEVYCRPRMPSAFSPNGSGTNDAFRLLVPLGCTLSIEQITIFNRWGETVYNSTGNEFTWDGSFEGVQAQQGVYLWEIKYSYMDDQGNEGNQSHQGSVFLLR